jgi:hypothetical protein
MARGITDLVAQRYALRDKDEECQGPAVPPGEDSIGETPRRRIPSQNPPERGAILQPPKPQIAPQRDPPRSSPSTIPQPRPLTNHLARAHHWVKRGGEGSCRR